MVNEPDAGRVGNSDSNPLEPKRIPPEGTIPMGVDHTAEVAAGQEAVDIATASNTPTKPAETSTPDSPSNHPPEAPTVTEGSGNPTEYGYGDGSPYSAYGYDGAATEPTTADGTAVAETSPSAESASLDSSGSGGSGASEPPASGGADNSGGSDAEEDEGGPVKSFLEHLEDLRWVLVKTAIALLLGMMVCLFGAKYVVAILEWPLQRAGYIRTALVGADTKTIKVGVAIGDHVLYTFKTETNQVGGFDLGTNPVAVLEFVPMQINTQTVLTLKLTRNPVVEKELNKGPKLYWLDPAAPFISSLHIAFFGGLVLAAPFLMYFIGQYILPALKWKEKKYLLRAFAIGTALFMIGVNFCYFLMAPMALRAAEQYSLWMGMEVPQWEASRYFSFICKFMLGMGLGFELPVVLLALVKIGILDYQKLKSFRRYMIVVNLIMGALLTTPEVLTQVMMFIPLQLLYEFSIWVAWYWERKEKKRAAEAEANGKPE